LSLMRDAEDVNKVVENGDGVLVEEVLPNS
jgi:hypothetical protein